MRAFLFLIYLVVFSATAQAGIALPAFVFAPVAEADETDERVHQLVREASGMIGDDPEQARLVYIDALRLVHEGAAIDEYDYLWTQYGLLRSSYHAGTGEFGPGTRDDYVRVAEQVIDYLDEATGAGIWEYTSLGAFQMEIYRTAGNGLAWELMSGSSDPQNLERALSTVEKAVDHVRGIEDYYIYDTKARILLKMKRPHEAFAIVREVLDEDPEFSDFQDLKSDPEYLKWLGEQG